MSGSLRLRFGIYASRSGTRKFESRILIRPVSPQYRPIKISNQSTFPSRITRFNKQLHIRCYRYLGYPVNRWIWHRHFYTEDVGYLFLRQVWQSTRLHGIITEDHVQLQYHSTCPIISLKHKICITSFQQDVVNNNTCKWLAYTKWTCEIGNVSWAQVN